MWEMAGKNLGNFRMEETFTDMAKGARFLIRTSFLVNNSQGYFADAGLGTPMDFQILLFLMKQHNGKNNMYQFLEDKIIFNECNDGKWSIKRFAIRLNWLHANQYVIKGGVGRQYAIFDKGIIVVMDFIKWLAAHADLNS